LSKREGIFFCLLSLVVILISSNVVYGLAGSLENLRHQLNGENSYRAELENYVTSNNISLGEPGTLQLNDFTDAELEEFVKAHMNGDMVTVTGMISDKVNEKVAPAFDRLGCAIDPDC
jgi:hypothetical protein